MMPAEHLNRQRPSGSLDRFYELPNESRSLADWRRLRHFDLGDFDDLDLDLDRECFRLSARIAHDPDRHRRAWLAERRDLVARELRLRRRAVA